MTQEERVKSLARLYCSYMTEYHEAQRDLYKTIKEGKGTIDIVCAINYLERIDRLCINPILKLLQEENVQYIEEENGQTVVHMQDYQKFIIDEKIKNPFKVEDD